MGTLTGKTALVTGGSRGIGRAIAERLGAEGARVAVHYNKNEVAAKETVAAIETAGGSAFAIRAELGVAGDAAQLWAEFDALAEGVDILINNAGVVHEATIADTDDEGYDRVFAINTKAQFFVTKHGIERLRDGGRIVNLSTGFTHGAGSPGHLAYSMTKGAIDVFTATLAKELGARGITVNAVAPGATDTDMNAGWLRSDEAQAQVSAMSPLQRVGQADDIADVVAFLAGPDSRWVTGQWIDATGGALL